MYRTQAQRIWSAEARAKVLYFFNNFSFETEEYTTRAIENQCEGHVVKRDPGPPRLPTLQPMSTAKHTLRPPRALSLDSMAQAMTATLHVS